MHVIIQLSAHFMFCTAVCLKIGWDVTVDGLDYNGLKLGSGC